jgi:hypothetical protein
MAVNKIVHSSDEEEEKEDTNGDDGNCGDVVDDDSGECDVGEVARAVERVQLDKS